MAMWKKFYSIPLDYSKLTGRLPPIREILQINSLYENLIMSGLSFFGHPVIDYRSCQLWSSAFVVIGDNLTAR